VSTAIHLGFRRFKTGLALAAVAFALSGCASGKWGFPYKAPVQQGNWITSEQVALLQAGMTREQVRFALGSPTLTSVLHANRWDYPYYFKPGYGDPKERKFTVFFDNDRLVRWEGDQQPDLQPYQSADADSKRALKRDIKADTEAARQNDAEGSEKKITPRVGVFTNNDALSNQPGDNLNMSNLPGAPDSGTQPLR
jgi:outer membrane protein assembly factor BamE